jgi:formate dehydrogenase subunit gamma
MVRTARSTTSPLPRTADRAQSSVLPPARLALGPPCPPIAPAGILVTGGTIAASAAAEPCMPDYKLLQRYRELLVPFRPDQGDLLAALHSLQHEFGYVPTDAIPEVARALRTNSAAVFGALSFYSEFRTTPPPKNILAWCSGPACRLKGGDNIRLVFETVWDIPMEGETADGELGMHLGQCNGTCEAAPQVWLNGVVWGPLHVGDAVEMARRLKTGERNS